MAIWDLNKQRYKTNNSKLFEASVPVDVYGNPLGGSEARPTANSAFGENISVPITPVFQLDGLYGLPTDQFETYNFGTGSVTSGLKMTASTGTGAYGYGVVRSRRTVRYRPGQGALARFTAQFTSGTSGYTQRAGFFTQEQALQIGFDGTQFGILRENGGKAHIQKVTITGGAGGSENVTITLNGTAFVIAVTSGTARQNATTIGNTAFAGWVVDYCDDEIHFLSTTLGPKAGAFSVSSTGSLTATTTTAQTGVATTTNWTYQSSFNIDTLDGNGPSGMTLDPTKLNVYQINFRWLGAGEMRFAIENPLNGDMIAFHHIHYSNQNTTVHLDNPSLKIGYVAADLTGSGGTDVSVSGASMMGAIEGLIQNTKYPKSATASITTNRAANTLHHILTVTNNLISSNKINSRELLIKRISLGAVSAATAPVSVFLYLDGTTAANLQFTEVGSFSCQSVTETTMSAGLTPICTFATTSGSSLNEDIDDLRIVIPAGANINLAVQSTGLLSRIDASITFIED